MHIGRLFSLIAYPSALLFIVEQSATVICCRLSGVFPSHFFFSRMSDSNCLDPVKFNTASAAWTDAVTSGGDLLHYFQNSVVSPGLPPPPPPLPVNKLQYVTFSVDDMIALVSTVGVRYIRAQFLLMPVPPEASEKHPEFEEYKEYKPRFTVALYALDSLKCRISAYFAGAAGAMMPFIPAPGDEGCVPFDLVQHWLRAW